MPWFHLKCPECGNEFNLDYNYLAKDIKIPNIPGVRFYTPHIFSVKCPSCGKRTRYHTTDEDIVNPQDGSAE